MKNDICPQCQSTEVYKKKNGLQSYGGVYAKTGVMTGSAIDAYVCANCAYVAMYIADESKLKDIVAKWEKA